MEDKIVLEPPFPSPKIARRYCCRTDGTRASSRNKDDYQFHILEIRSLKTPFRGISRCVGKAFFFVERGKLVNRHRTLSKSTHAYGAATFQQFSG